MTNSMKNILTTFIVAGWVFFVFIAAMCLSGLAFYLIAMLINYCFMTAIPLKGAFIFGALFPLLRGFIFGFRSSRGD